MNRRDIQTEFETLPPDAQREVVDFIAFLRERHGAEQPAERRKHRDISKERCIGMWRDHKDMKDSSGWVLTLREREWTKR